MEQRLNVADGASLEWFPQDTILFPGAKAETRITIDLAPTAQFIGWEILCLGLPTNKQLFSSGSLHASLSLSRQQTPLFKDILRISSDRDLHRSSGLQGFQVSATFLATGCSKAMLPPLHSLESSEEKSLYGVTLLDDLLVARYLGYSTFAAQELFVQIWKLLRPHLIGKEACLPRIWAT
jgi:urease accessory protein